jgi:hypothetical protein
MKIKNLAVALAIAIGSTANADVLLWQVADNPSPSTGDGGVPWTYAVIKATDGSSDVTLGNIVGDYDGAEKVGASVFDIANVAARLPSDTSTTAYSIYMELYDANGMVATSQDAPVSLSTLTQYISASENASNWGAMNKWGGPGAGSFRVVPEPTSGLMLLMGAAMLSLRRKKRA